MIADARRTDFFAAPPQKEESNAFLLLKTPPAPCSLQSQVYSVQPRIGGSFSHRSRGVPFHLASATGRPPCTLGPGLPRPCFPLGSCMALPRHHRHQKLPRRPEAQRSTAHCHSLVPRPLALLPTGRRVTLSLRTVRVHSKHSAGANCVRLETWLLVLGLLLAC